MSKVKFEEGQGVLYIPYEGCNEEYWEEGVVTKITVDEFKVERIYVKYLKNYGNETRYTQPMLTPRHRLRKD